MWKNSLYTIVRMTDRLSSLAATKSDKKNLAADRDWLASIRWLPHVRNYCGRVVVSRCYHEETTPIRDRIHGGEGYCTERGCVNTYYVTIDVCTCEDMNKHALCVSQIVIYEIKFYDLWCTGCIRFVKPCRCTLFPFLLLVWSLIGLACRSTIVDHIASIIYWLSTILFPDRVIIRFIKQFSLRKVFIFIVNAI